jgi:MFS family permease
VRSPAFAILAVGAFVVALGYGVVLPIVPLLVERFAGAAGPSDIAWHTGALTGAYMLAVFACAPLWGRMSDRFGRRTILFAGFFGYVVMLVAFALSRSLWLAYVTRVLTGAFVSAVLTVASAYVAEIADEPERARRYAALGAATLLGYLAGPALSGAVYSAARAMDGSEAMVANMAVWPLLATAALGLGVLTVAFASALGSDARQHAGQAHAPARGGPAKGEVVLLALNFLAMLGLGAFEVALPLAGRTATALDPGEIALLFIGCSLMMLAVQGVLFFAPLLTRERSRHLLGAGFVAMAAGFALLGSAAGFGSVLFAVALVAAGAGLLLPAVVFVASLRRTARVGTALGLLIGAGSLGQAVGSAAGAWLFAGLSADAFWVAGALMVGGALASIARPLVPARAGYNLSATRSVERESSHGA